MGSQLSATLLAAPRARQLLHLLQSAAAADQISAYVSLADIICVAADSVSGAPSSSNVLAAAPVLQRRRGDAAVPAFLQLPPQMLLQLCNDSPAEFVPAPPSYASRVDDILLYLELLRTTADAGLLGSKPLDIIQHVSDAFLAAETGAATEALFRFAQQHTAEHMNWLMETVADWRKRQPVARQQQQQVS